VTIDPGFSACAALSVESDSHDDRADHQRLANSQVQDVVLAIPVDDLLQKKDTQNHDNHAEQLGFQIIDIVDDQPAWCTGQALNEEFIEAERHDIKGGPEQKNVDQLDAFKHQITIGVRPKLRLCGENTDENMNEQRGPVSD